MIQPKSYLLSGLLRCGGLEVRPLLVCTVPSDGGSDGKGGCEDCSLTVGCSKASSLLVGISSLEVVGDTISWRRFHLRVPWDVCTV